MENTTGTWNDEESADAPGIIKIATPIFFIAGLVGNVTTLFVLCRKKLIKSASTMFLISLVVVDLVVLHTIALSFWLAQLVGQRKIKSSVTCKIQVLLMFLTRDLSVWLLVAITISRLIAIQWPLKYKIICSRHRACASVILISVLCLIANGHFLVGYGWTVVNRQNGTSTEACAPVLDYEGFLRIWPIILLIKTSVVPTTIMFAGSIAIICNLYRSRNSSISQSRKNGGRSKTSMSLLLLGLNIVHICCTLPLGVYLMISTDMFEPNTGFFVKSQDLVLEALLVVNYLNHVINIFLYCFTGSLFRSELKDMLTSCKNKLRGT